MVARVIAFANQKGGVGKTTSCVNLAASLVATKRNVLLIDLDPQGNATMASGVDKNSLSLSSKDVLLDKADITTACVPSSAGYDIVGANSDLTMAEVSLLQVFGREKRLDQALEKVKISYDYIFIDCPPSLNMLTVNALAAADSVLIPMQCEYFALEGLTALLNTIEHMRQGPNPDLAVEGLLRTMYDGRNRLANEVSQQLTAHFGAKVYRTVIPRNVRLAEAPSHGKPVLHYARRSQGATAYLALAGELIRRQEQPVSTMDDDTDRATTQ